MARVRETVPAYGLYPHREHRSKKGRRKMRIEEIKSGRYHKRLKKENKFARKQEKKEYEQFIATAT